MKNSNSLLFHFLAVVIIISINKLTAQIPPYGGTIFLDPDIITPEDPTTFLDLADAGRGIRTMFDRRENDWISVNAYLFDARFDDGLSTEIQINPEFGSTETALAEAEKYAPIIGQLPTALRKDAKTVWIHKGVNPFGGGNNNILIHTGQAALYVNDGILEETLIHEASHTSLDAEHALSAGWIAAQNADPTFISTYAQDFFEREDIAESFLLYVALRHKADRIDETLKNTILETIPNRIEYFDGLMLDMHPYGLISSITEKKIPKVFIRPNPIHDKAILTYELAKTETISIELYSFNGQHLKAIQAPSNQVAGTHIITFSRQDLTNGVYFIQIKTQRLFIMQKIVLL